MDPKIREFSVNGYPCTVNDTLGLLSVAHDGWITWDDLQAIKDAVWGPDTRAIEVYPRAADVVNSRTMRHLWRLGRHDFCPDLLNRPTAGPYHHDSLFGRCMDAWVETGGASPVWVGWDMAGGAE